MPVKSYPLFVSQNFQYEYRPNTKCVQPVSYTHLDVYKRQEMNYTKAAERLHITQPAVSQHIHYLEQHYGCALFTFTGKKLNLTNAGKLLLNAMQTQQHDCLLYTSSEL